MAKTTKDDEQKYYICGQCETKIFYLKSEEPPSICPDCGWGHNELGKYSVPETIKLNLNQY